MFFLTPYNDIMNKGSIGQIQNDIYMNENWGSLLRIYHFIKTERKNDVSLAEPFHRATCKEFEEKGMKQLFALK